MRCESQTKGWLMTSDEIQRLLTRFAKDLTALFLLFCLVVAGIGYLGYRDEKRIKALETEQFRGYLYVLNDEKGTWDRLRNNQVDLCKSRECRVWFFEY